MLTSNEIDQLVRRIVERAQPDKVIVFGSYAKGTATIKSDLDILVIKETNLPMTHRTAELKPIVSRTLIPVDIHVYTPEEVEEFGREEYSFIRTVLTTGRMVYQK